MYFFTRQPGREVVAEPRRGAGRSEQHQRHQHDGGRDDAAGLRATRGASPHEYSSHLVRCCRIRAYRLPSRCSDQRSARPCARSRAGLEPAPRRARDRPSIRRDGRARPKTDCAVRVVRREHLDAFAGAPHAGNGALMLNVSAPSSRVACSSQTRHRRRTRSHVLFSALSSRPRRRQAVAQGRPPPAVCSRRRCMRSACAAERPERCRERARPHARGGLRIVARRRRVGRMLCDVRRGGDHRRGRGARQQLDRIRAIELLRMPAAATPFMKPDASARLGIWNQRARSRSPANGALAVKLQP